MARVAPASESFWAMPQAMLRLLARPKTTATLPLRSIMLCDCSCLSSVGKDSRARLNTDLHRSHRFCFATGDLGEWSGFLLFGEPVVLGVGEGDYRETELAEEDRVFEGGGFAHLGQC